MTLFLSNATRVTGPTQEVPWKGLEDVVGVGQMEMRGEVKIVFLCRWHDLILENILKTGFKNNH